MEKQMYFDYAKAVNDKIREQVNGYVRYRVHTNIDAIIFTINFKDFDFEYALGEIEEKVYAGDSELVAEEILNRYRSAIMSAFFKTDKRKERENKRKFSFVEDCV